ncbi:META domain-containing protein [Namhaeicola litoreus]|uniref:META domain-containing protein n=1 Tax=Namhaeicola litoreus TaxID=1052145 RepID=A0ABW3Y278_9FLAO
MRNIYLFFILFVLVSCGTSQSTTYVDPHAEKHLTPHENFAIEQQKAISDKEMALKIQGIYEGLVPCADCKGIQTKIQLYPDMMYRTEMTYTGKSATPIIESGKYSINNQGILLLGDSPNGYNQIIFQDGYLVILDKNGNHITGNLAERYYLYPPNQQPKMENKEMDANFLIEKHQRGIDFYAQGNEPSWNLEMDLDKVMTFKNMDGLVFTAPSVEPSLAMDANVKRYRAITESGEIIIQLHKVKCSDTMSDKEFGYKVNIDFKSSNENNYVSYTGCGDYVPNTRLHNIWAIKSVNGKTLNKDDFKQKYPTLEINTSNGKVFGNDGCNNFNGSLSFEPGKLEFGPMASTMMACFENQEISNAIGKTLSGMLDYSFEDNELILSKNGKTVMTLKNVD